MRTPAAIGLRISNYISCIVGVSVRVDGGLPAGEFLLATMCNARSPDIILIPQLLVSESKISELTHQV